MGKYTFASKKALKKASKDNEGSGLIKKSRKERGQRGAAVEKYSNQKGGEGLNNLGKKKKGVPISQVKKRVCELKRTTQRELK